jgi:hypothetical protein
MIHHKRHGVQNITEREKERKKEKRERCWWCFCFCCFEEERVKKEREKMNQKILKNKHTFPLLFSS